MPKTMNSQRPLQWHPAFYAGIQIELKEDAANLIFENEHQLSKKPMGIDVLIIKKIIDEPVRKNIGKIFKKHNIVEYKAPGDYVSIDTFYKVQGYACFYKSDTTTVDEIKSNEITVTYVSEFFPKKLIKHLQKDNSLDIINVSEGIYYIYGLYFPVQLLITSDLSPEENLWLHSLTNRIQEHSYAEKLLLEYGKHKSENLYKSMMNVIVKANNKVFEEVNNVCDALLEIVKDELDERERKGEANGEQNKLLEQIRKKIAKGKSDIQISDELEEDLVTIQKLMKLL